MGLITKSVMKLFEVLWYLTPLIIVILGIIGIFNDLNTQDIFSSVSIMITTYVVLMGFFIAIYPRKIVDLDRKWNEIENLVKKQTPKMKKVILKYRHQFDHVKIERKDEERVIPNPEYIEKLRFSSFIFLKYLGMGIFLFLMLIMNIFKNSIFEFDVTFFYIMYFEILWIYFFVIFMILRRIAIFHIQYYIQNVIIPDVLLNPEFYDEMLMGRQAINEIVKMEERNEIQIPWLLRLFMKCYRRKIK